MTFDDRPVRAQPAHEPTSTDPDTPTDEYLPLRVEPESARTSGKARRQGSALREIVETLLLAVIIFVAVRAVVLNFRVDGLSMNPSMQDNEMVLVNRNVYLHFDTWALVDWLPFVEHEETNVVYPFHPPERGDIIVFDAPVNNASKPYIKRVIALPGETVEARDGHVYINGHQIDEPYLEGEETWCGVEQNCPPVTVPEGSVFVLGDNRDNSQDSRAFGPVAIDRIIGKAWITYWPFSEAGIVPHYDYPELPDAP
jgi:signal peptidase I